MSDLPKRVLIDEEGPREGFQSEKKMIPVADKVRLIEALAQAGLRDIQSSRSSTGGWCHMRDRRRRHILTRELE